MSKLYANIRKRRTELGMSQEELAQKTGYSGKSMIAHIEKGEVDLPQSKIMIFAKALKIHPGDLLGWDEEDELQDKSETPALEQTPDLLVQVKEKQYIALFEKIRELNDSDLASISERVDEMLSDAKYSGN